MSAAKKFNVVSVGVAADLVTVWAIPSWLKSSRAITADLSPRQARKLAIQLLQAADSASGEDR